jgi:hypothetical protein
MCRDWAANKIAQSLQTANDCPSDEPPKAAPGLPHVEAAIANPSIAFAE